MKGRVGTLPFIYVYITIHKFTLRNMSFWNSLCCSDNNKWVHFCMCEYRKVFSVGMHQFWSVCSGRWFPESARWLAAKGRTAQCARELRHIAQTNGTVLPGDTMLTLQKIAAKKEKIYGLASLFSNWRLAKNTLLVVYLWWVSRGHRRLSFFNFYAVLFTIRVVKISDFSAKGNLLLENMAHYIDW